MLTATTVSWGAPSILQSPANPILQWAEDHLCGFRKWYLVRPIQPRGITEAVGQGLDDAGPGPEFDSQPNPIEGEPISSQLPVDIAIRATDARTWRLCPTTSAITGDSFRESLRPTSLATWPPRTPCLRPSEADGSGPPSNRSQLTTPRGDVCATPLMSVPTVASSLSLCLSAHNVVFTWRNEGGSEAGKGFRPQSSPRPEDAYKRPTASETIFPPLLLPRRSHLDL
ncbi:hypothetical protein N7462_004075 [Penicillium macrosclerotiorum]|uniref:uncharacterized protein n=1 Tax=Penicillium macrosclerotiorum TaxID=303699 RepID=UPI002548B71A|nr:uncharacterized protein N7462_004075 [Penicillium macrosclerotiorum]KAJ5689683.1 hypothetical protein N7462_004075 [Penicillium macrosclerotiorum]